MRRAFELTKQGNPLIARRIQSSSLPTNLAGRFATGLPAAPIWWEAARRRRLSQKRVPITSKWDSDSSDGFLGLAAPKQAVWWVGWQPRPESGTIVDTRRRLTRSRGTICSGHSGKRTFPRRPSRPTIANLEVRVGRPRELTVTALASGIGAPLLVGIIQQLTAERLSERCKDRRRAPSVRWLQKPVLRLRARSGRHWSANASAGGDRFIGSSGARQDEPEKTGYHGSEGFPSGRRSATNAH